MLNFQFIPQLFLGLLQLIFSNISSLERGSPKQFGCEPVCATWPWGQGSVLYSLFPNNSARNRTKNSPLQYRYRISMNFLIFVSYEFIINNQILKVAYNVCQYALLERPVDCRSYNRCFFSSIIFDFFLDLCLYLSFFFLNCIYTYHDFGFLCRSETTPRWFQCVAQPCILFFFNLFSFWMLWIFLLIPPLFLIILISLFASAIALLLTQYCTISMRSASAPRNPECLILFHFFPLLLALFSSGCFPS